MIITRNIRNSITVNQEKNEEVLMEYIKSYISFWLIIFLHIHQNNNFILRIKLYLIILFYLDLLYTLTKLNKNSVKLV